MNDRTTVDAAKQPLSVTLDDIQAAERRIETIRRRTPVLAISGRPNLLVKAESLQLTGAFKIRGALNAVTCVAEAYPGRGVVTYSSGNHGQALACAASLLGVDATVVMPIGASAAKRQATASWGAKIVDVDPRERVAVARALSQSTGADYVPPYDDARVIAGQGTIGLELVEQVPELDCVLVPVGGGGLISGISIAIKSLRPQVRMVGVEPVMAGDLAASMHAGRRLEWAPELVARTVADGLRAESVGILNWPIIRALVDDILTVEEDEIRRAMRAMAEQGGMMLEPSGAVAFAGYLSDPDAFGCRATVIASGRNISLADFCVAASATNPASTGGDQASSSG